MTYFIPGILPYTPPGLRKNRAVKIIPNNFVTSGDPTLSSALSGFTSEFEMESDGTHLLLSPGEPVGCAVVTTQPNLNIS